MAAFFIIEINHTKDVIGTKHMEKFAEGKIASPYRHGMSNTFPIECVQLVYVPVT